MGEDACSDPEGGGGGTVGPDPPPPEKSQKYMVTIAILVRKITMLPLSQPLMLGHLRHVRETPSKWHFAGGPMMARLKWYLDPTKTKTN